MKAANLAKAAVLLAVAFVVTARGAETRACWKTAGLKRAQLLAADCQQMAESRHAPCHVNNPCRVMIDLIGGLCSEQQTLAENHPGKGYGAAELCQRYLRPQKARKPGNW